MGKKTPKAPTPPDPYATAQAQGQMNKDTAVSEAYLNRVNQYTPEGSLTWSTNGTNPDGTPRFESRQTYSPEQQALYDSGNKVEQALSDTALKNVGKVNEAQSKPWDTSGMTPLQFGGQGGNLQYGYDPGGKIQTGFDAGGPINRDYASGGDIQRDLDYSKLAQIPGIGDYGAEAKRVQDAVYNQATSRLDPRMEAEQRQLASTLAAKGVSENSTAYRNAMDQFTRNKTDAYNQATYSGIQAGSQEQSRLFGLGLQGRQQGVSEINTQGGFHNTAQAQAEAQNAAHAQFGNDAQQQQYTQNMGQAEFGNQAQGQQNQQNAAGAAFNNTAQQQGFNQSFQNATMNNQARNQQMQEAAFARSLPINEIAALMSGSQVSAPQFSQYAQPGVKDTDYSGLVQNQYANQMGQYNQQMATRNAGLGSIFGLAGSLATKLPMFSDRRLKHHIEQIGQLTNGIKTYVFSYIGSAQREFGFMADEVLKAIPDAVGRRDGFMTVDQGKVWRHGFA